MKTVTIKTAFTAIMLTLSICIGGVKSAMGQVIKGSITDAVTGVPLIGATAVIVGSDPQIGAISDYDGLFKFNCKKPGRYDIRIQCMGYKSYQFSEIMVASGKESTINATLEITATNLDEVSVTYQTSKEKAMNSMATISARQLSVEESNRYAGGFDDPARLAGSFAGVASELGNNGIVIRGNNPQSMLWRMEGIEISNPTHFANVISFGAGGTTALSSQVLANSDFFTGAFPAEYGNALSGVFDIKLRSGNRDKREYTFQAGITGIDFAAEGPFKKGKNATYLFNYRFSTYALLGSLIPPEAGTIGFQDLSFKINVPTKKSGNFTLWGIGAIDNQNKDAFTDSAKWKTQTDDEAFSLNLSNGAIGLSNKKIFGTSTYLHTSIAASGNKINTDNDKLDSSLVLYDSNQVKNDTWKYTFASTLNHRFNPNHNNRTGIIYNKHYYKVDNREAVELGDPMTIYAKESGNTSTVQAFTQSQIKLRDGIDLNVGVHMHYFGLANEINIEPRLGLKWQLDDKNSIGMAYGLNSRLEMIGFYLAQQNTPNGVVQPNKDLGLTKSHHFGLEYSLQINSSNRLKIEPYYQKLYDVPVIPDSYFSLQNMELDWFFNETLVNEGTGVNYGVDITLERFLKKGFYYLVTASIFDSKYVGGDNIERNALYDKGYIVNLVAGKEWSVGKDGDNIIGLNGKLSFIGGDRLTPILFDESVESGEIIYDYSRAFEDKEDMAKVLSLSGSYKINRKKYTSTWSIHILNALGHEEYRGYDFNIETGALEQQFDKIMVPNVSYKIEF